MNKIKLGKGRSVEKFDMVNFSICISDIPVNEIYEYKDKKYINCTISRMDEPDQWGKTHNVYLNTWKPKQKTDIE